MKPFILRLRHAAQLCMAATLTLAGLTAAHAATEDQNDLVARGAYLATAGDCIACHTARGGMPFAGGNPIDSPLGTIWSTNITPSQQDGIGRYTLAQFSAALREGVRADGARLYPAMPYTSYTLLSDDDVNALYAYFMHGVKAVDKPAPQTQLPFPFNVRMMMWGWDLMFNSNQRFDFHQNSNAQWLRGAYLAEGLAHCSTCHTPRNALMAEDFSLALSGAQVGKWYAPNITSDPVHGIGTWSTAEIAQYLKTGHAPGKALAGGPMAEAIDHSFSKLSDADLQAMAVYIKSVAAHAGSQPLAPSGAKPAATSDEATLRGTVGMLGDGASLFSGNCAACHSANAGGSPQGHGTPGLVGITAVSQSNPDNLVMAILDGVDRVSGTPRLMPAFAEQLTDAQVATLATYVRTQFGNPALEPVTEAQVAALRAPTPPDHTLVWLARAGVAVAVVVILAILVWVSRRRRQRQSV